MIATTLSNFLNNAETLIENTLINEETIKVTTKSGNLVLITESQYEAFIDSLIRTQTRN